MDEDLKNVQEELELYKTNGPIGLYYELNRFVNSTVNIMRATNLQTLIAGGKDKDDDPKKFEKIMALIKNAKEHVSDMHDMKEKLNLSGDEAKDKLRPFTTMLAKTRN